MGRRHDSSEPSFGSKKREPQRFPDLSARAVAWKRLIRADISPKRKLHAMKTTLRLLLTPLSLCASDFPTPYNSETDKSKAMPATEAAPRMQ
jgi:hypothetical protein